MRIVGGSCRGRRLTGPAGQEARPTSDRAREAVFQIVGSEIRGARVLDLFAGTGAMGLEAASRGAARVDYVDASAAMIGIIVQNIVGCYPGARLSRPGRALHILEAGSSRHLVFNQDLSSAPGGLAVLAAGHEGAPWDVIFCDPPYGWLKTEELLRFLSAASLVAPGGLLLLETAKGSTAPECMHGLCLVDQRRYGAACFHFYRQYGRFP